MQISANMLTTHGKNPQRTFTGRKNTVRISIQYKLFTAMLCATLVVVGLMTIVIQWGFDRGFLEYVNVEEQEEISRFAQQLEDYYAAKQNWRELAAEPLEVLKLHAMVVLQGRKKHHFHEVSIEGKMPKWMLETIQHEPRRHPIQRTILLDEKGKIFFGQKLHPWLPHLIPIMFEGREVGNVGLYPPKKLSETSQLMFREKQNSFILTACILAILVTIAISMLLAYNLTKPIRRLSFAARRLTEGDYSIRVQTGSRDELERLSSNFNLLAKTLEKNEDQRKQWVSDIAHELRTPLTTLKSQIEALQDGIRQPNAQTYDTLHKGVMRLERLIEDLYDLSRSDLGTFALITRKIDLGKLVENEVSSRQHEVDSAGLTLTISMENEPVLVDGDPQRLLQLTSNLLTNSIRYTDAGGEIEVQVTTDGGAGVLDVIDSSPGVPDEALPKLFDRLYRVEESRNRALGGAGLGLAICHQIALAHNGSIQAFHSNKGGLHFRVTIPSYTEETA